ncbi:conserved putative secreted protein [Candidatus Protochlamydia naegleriophila]|uniref:Conserved putative secreted protein n=2 Tax=Candidatus Protochlamydia naegleriophila TaxID=389348 RepID=A0A0U5ESR4_9BACT|nr:conserved putative secreted protein [Candidatus Protochlamydia naegleriophila]
MKKFFFSAVCTGCLLSAPFLSAAPNPPSKMRSSESLDSGIVLFTPPPGWRMADSKLLPERVRLMVVGQGPSAFPPSMNLSLEPYSGSLKEYLKIIKNMNDAQGFEWKDLGTIRTEAGTASLSQVDTKTEWGNVRLMHVILLKNGTIYILTASALKDEFSQFYKEFFASMRSLRVAKDAFEMIVNTQQRTQLKNAVQKLGQQWQKMVEQQHRERPDIAIETLKEQVFNSESFQTTLWTPFKDMLNQKYSDMGKEWQALLLTKIEDELFELRINQGQNT